MKLMHYSQEPVAFDRDWEYPQEGSLMDGLKPNGLWVSVVGPRDWPDMCSAMGWDFRLRYAYRVELASDINLLWLKSPEDLLGFHEDYAVDSGLLEGAPVSDEFIQRFRFIEWGRVVKEYDGIIIAPYQWQARTYGPSWYRSWDCASGVIFSTAAVDSVTLVARAALYGTL